MALINQGPAVVIQQAADPHITYLSTTEFGRHRFCTSYQADVLHNQRVTRHVHSGAPHLVVLLQVRLHARTGPYYGIPDPDPPVYGDPNYIPGDTTSHRRTKFTVYCAELPRTIRLFRSLRHNSNDPATPTGLSGPLNLHAMRRPWEVLEMHMRFWGPGDVETPTRVTDDINILVPYDRRMKTATFQFVRYDSILPSPRNPNVVYVHQTLVDQTRVERDEDEEDEDEDGEGDEDEDEDEDDDDEYMEDA